MVGKQSVGQMMSGKQSVGQMMSGKPKMCQFYNITIWTVSYGNKSCNIGPRGVPDDDDDDLIDLFDEAFDLLTTVDQIDRQTGEAFTSAAPADCRVRATGACGTG